MRELRQRAQQEREEFARRMASEVEDVNMVRRMVESLCQLDSSAIREREMKRKAERENERNRREKERAKAKKEKGKKKTKKARPVSEHGEVW